MPRAAIESRRTSCERAELMTSRYSQIATELALDEAHGQPGRQVEGPHVTVVADDRELVEHDDILAGLPRHLLDAGSPGEAPTSTRARKKRFQQLRAQHIGREREPPSFWSCSSSGASVL